ncbi:MAG: cytochrome c [Cytophagaceae bacterium]|nr:cytochrome c [Cytophagaceae bacterium]
MKTILLFIGLSWVGWEAWLPSAHPTRLPAFKSESVADSGKVIYDTYCLSCHQANGAGVPRLNPPLAKTDWVLGDKTRLIGVLLNGLDEEVEINGETYANAMPAHNFLTDKQIADVLTFVRTNFGNQASAVMPEEVKEVRSKKK